MQNDASEWDRNEQFRVFLLFVAINVLSAGPRPNALIHLSVDQDNVALPLGYGLHAHGIAGPHSRVNEIVSAPSSRCECSRRFPTAFRMLVNELNGDDLVGGVGHQIKAIKVSFEGAVIAYVVRGVFRKTWRRHRYS